MAKRYRGKTLWRMPSRGRGKCPLCGKTRIKLLYPYRTEETEMVKVCKHCRKK